ncbi:hypothetical protein [Vibrio jasicida]|uniref:Uncharacterized protein n=1 Tax=Vibrio jasicida TaxID=766224 RepID=A0ABW7JEU9_9VIBR
MSNSNLQQLKQIVERTDGATLIERGLMLSLINNVDKQIKHVIEKLDMCCGTSANKVEIKEDLDMMRLNIDLVTTGASYAELFQPNRLPKDALLSAKPYGKSRFEDIVTALYQPGILPSSTESTSLFAESLNTMINKLESNEKARGNLYCGEKIFEAIKRKVGVIYGMEFNWFDVKIIRMPHLEPYSLASDDPEIVKAMEEFIDRKRGTCNE